MIRAKFKSIYRKYFLTTVPVEVIDSVIVTFYLFPETCLVSDSYFFSTPTFDKYFSLVYQVFFFF